MLASNMTIIYKILAQKYAYKAYRSQIKVILFFGEISQLDKYEDADFKSDNTFLKF